MSKFVSLSVLISVGVLSLLACTEQKQLGATPTHLSTEESSFEFSSSGEPILFIPPNKDQALSTADLAIEFIPNVDNISSEKNIHLLTIYNLGPDPATDILINDLLPDGTTLDQTQPIQPSCYLDGNQVTCDIGGLKDRDKVTVTLDLSANPDRSYLPEIQLSRVNADLGVPVCTVTQALGQPHILCRLDSLQPGVQAQLRVGANPALKSPQTILHAASISAREFDPNLSNNSAIATVISNAEVSEVAPSPPLATDLVVQLEGPATVVAGQPFAYRYTITNRGRHDATGVTFMDTIPPDLELIRYAPSLPQCEQKDDAFTCSLHDPDSGKTAVFTLVLTGYGEQPVKLDIDPLVPGWPLCYVLKERQYQHTLRCDFGTLKAGQSTHVQLELLAIGVRERTTANTATVQANEIDLVTLDNSSTITMAIKVQADLLVDATALKKSATDNTLSYTIMINNLGPSAADDVILTDTLPEDINLVSAVPGQGDECRIEMDSILACILGYLERGETAVVNITIAVDSLAMKSGVEMLTHSIWVSSGSPDPNAGNNVLTSSISLGGTE